MEQKTKGSGFLKVTGILMIIAGAIALIVSIITVAGIGAVVAPVSYTHLDVYKRQG